MITSAVETGESVSSAVEHPLALAVRRRDFTNLVTWPFTGETPSRLAGLGPHTAECPSRKGGGQILWNVRVGEYRIDASVYVAETGETATATRRIVVI